MSGAPLFYADIGGTFARFALGLPGERPAPPAIYASATHPDLDAAIADFLDAQGAARPLGGAIVAAAGPLTEDGIDLTNSPWVVSHSMLRRTTGAAISTIVNDFTAVAASLASLEPQDVTQIGGGEASPHAPKAVLGPGTGLGVSALIPLGDGRWTPLASEGGHVDLAPADEREIAVVFHLIRMHGHVSVERVLSGPGLETLYETLAALDGAKLTGKLTASDIAMRARNRSDVLAAETVKLFCGWLGAVAGDLVLTVGGFGGVYLAGGILQRWGDLFDAALFRRRFEAKGRHRPLMAAVPAYRVETKDVAFVGLNAIARGDRIVLPKAQS